MNKRIVILLVVGVLTCGSLVFWMWQNSKGDSITVTAQDKREYAKKLGVSVPKPSPLIPLDLKRPVRPAIGSWGLQIDPRRFAAGSFARLFSPNPSVRFAEGRSGHAVISDPGGREAPSKLSSLAGL